MPHDNLKTIYVSQDTHEALRKLAFDRRLSMGDIVADALACYMGDPRSAGERAADDFAAEVLDTQESDRP
jgi:hypothetical protein